MAEALAKPADARVVLDAIRAAEKAEDIGLDRQKGKELAEPEPSRWL